MGSSAAEIRAEIERLVRSSAEVDAALNEFMEREVVPYAKSQYPVDSGQVAAQVKVTKKARRGKGEVGNTSKRAHLIEYGTKGDKKGGARPVKTAGDKSTGGGWKSMTADTPTPEFAPLAKTAKHFGGDMNRGISDDDPDIE